jgi:anti-sigma regulatory factor (Ser/Thr protein kinase)
VCSSPAWCRRFHTRAGVTLRKDQTCPTVGDIERLLFESFDHSRVTALRHAVASCAGAAGLADGRLEDFVMAVNELLTNAVRHGGGSGHLKLWRENGSVVCEVVDRGAGLADSPRDRPAVDDPGGRGLWLAGELTDTIEIQTGAEGTTVRISTRGS